MMMNSYFELKLHCNFPFCDDFRWSSNMTETTLLAL
jgi:hypothetical protein